MNSYSNFNFTTVLLEYAYTIHVCTVCEINYKKRSLPVWSNMIYSLCHEHCILLLAGHDFSCYYTCGIHSHAHLFNQALQEQDSF